MRTGWRQNTISRLLPLALLAACDATSSSAALTAADAGGDGALGQCIGVKPPTSAWTAVAGPQAVTATTAPTVGAAEPAFALPDFQPQSCGFGATYGLPVAHGKVTVVALFAGWCGYCVTQSGKLEELRLELQKAGYDLEFLTVNKADAVANQQALIDQCAFPLLQDSDAVNAWGQMGGQKDDFILYGADGKVADYLPYGGDRVTALSTHEGYANLKDAIIAATTKQP